MLASHCGSSNRRVEAFLKAGHASFADGPVNFQQEPCLTQHLASLKICDVQLSSQVVWPRSAVCRRDGRPLRHLIICNSRLTLSLLYIYSQSTSKAHLWQRLQDALSVPAWQAQLEVRTYQLNSEGAADETEGDVTSCNIWMLPAVVLACPTICAEMPMPCYVLVCFMTACVLPSSGLTECASQHSHDYC